MSIWEPLSFINYVFKLVLLLLFQADPNLIRLTAPQLRGTNSKAYILLARLASLIGWDELLKCRSKVFVMEEEYRMYKLQESKTVQSIVNGGSDSKSATSDTFKDDDDSASSRRGSQTARSATPVNKSNTALDNAEVEAGMQKLSVDDVSPGIPTIKVSAESDDEGANEEQRGGNTEPTTETKELTEPSAEPSTESSTEPSKEQPVPEYKEPTEPSRASLEGSIVVRPGAEEDQQEDEEGQGDRTQEDNIAAENNQQRESNSHSLSFVNKRLCERWLDHLFTELYEASNRNRVQGNE